MPIPEDSVDILRLAIALTGRAGLELLAPVHDAFLLHAVAERRSTSMGEVKRFPEKPSMPISEEQEEREFVEACRAGVLHKNTSKTAQAFAKKRKQSHRRQKRTFRMLPELWAVKLQDAIHIATLKLTNHLLACDWNQYGTPFEEGEPIKLTNGWLADNQISPRAKWRALQELETLGLIRVEHRPRRSPLITLIQ
jgi:hypothetical protein